jgi:hypothetical protein
MKNEIYTKDILLNNYGFEWVEKASTHTGYCLYKTDKYSISYYPNDGGRVFFFEENKDKYAKEYPKTNDIEEFKKFFTLKTGEELFYVS